jgi:hypothetical protein
MKANKLLSVLLSVLILLVGLPQNNYVLAENGIEESQPVEIQEAITPEIVAEKISETDTTATLRWDVTNADDISYYQVIAGSEIVADNIQALEYTVTELSSATTYSF